MLQTSTLAPASPALCVRAYLAFYPPFRRRERIELIAMLIFIRLIVMSNYFRSRWSVTVLINTVFMLSVPPDYSCRLLMSLAAHDVR